MLQGRTVEKVIIKFAHIIIHKKKKKTKDGTDIIQQTQIMK